jgi:hypothetical protein
MKVSMLVDLTRIMLLGHEDKSIEKKDRNKYLEEKKQSS